MHRPGQPPGRVHGEVRIIAVDLHAQRVGGVGHKYADGPKAHHAQGLALNLGPGELALALLHKL